MATLSISLFGNVQITREGWKSNLSITPKAQALLAYLLLQGPRPHPRELLIEIFWSGQNPKRARNSLRTTLWRLRSTLETDEMPQGAFLISTANDEIGFNWESDYWLDVAIFEEQAARILAKPFHTLQTGEVEALEEILLLYRGDLLEGFYDDWIIRRQERLQLLYLDCLEHLMRYCLHHNRYDQGLLYGQRILEREPVHEDIHREVMRIYLAKGQRALAVQQYEICRQVLAQELDVPPVEETMTLYGQALHESGESHPLPTIQLNRTGLQQALHQLGLATRHFNEAQIQLKRAKEKFDQAQQQLQQALNLLERAKKY